MKRERHGKIIELIGHYAIETQEELAEKARAAIAAATSTPAPASRRVLRSIGSSRPRGP